MGILGDDESLDSVSSNFHMARSGVSWRRFSITSGEIKADVSKELQGTHFCFPSLEVVVAAAQEAILLGGAD